MKKLWKNKKGFTLVEIIVVLVIIAILAAVIAPSMIGFIDEARNKADYAEARTVLNAVQWVATEEPLRSTTSVSAVTASSTSYYRLTTGITGSLQAVSIDGNSNVLSITYRPSGGTASDDVTLTK